MGCLIHLKRGPLKTRAVFGMNDKGLGDTGCDDCASVGIAKSKPIVGPVTALTVEIGRSARELIIQKLHNDLRYRY